MIMYPYNPALDIISAKQPGTLGMPKLSTPDAQFQQLSQTNIWTQYCPNRTFRAPTARELYQLSGKTRCIKCPPGHLRSDVDPTRCIPFALSPAVFAALSGPRVPSFVPGR